VIDNQRDAAQQTDHGEESRLFVQGGVDGQDLSDQDAGADSHEQQSPLQRRVRVPVRIEDAGINPFSMRATRSLRRTTRYTIPYTIAKKVIGTKTSALFISV